MEEKQPSEWPQLIYGAGGYITFWLVFIISWIYCVSEYGFLLGVGLGWLPSAIVGAIAAFLWPLLLCGFLALAWTMIK